MIHLAFGHKSLGSGSMHKPRYELSVSPRFDLGSRAMRQYVTNVPGVRRLHRNNEGRGVGACAHFSKQIVL